MLIPFNHRDVRAGQTLSGITCDFRPRNLCRPLRGLCKSFCTGWSWGEALAEPQVKIPETLPARGAGESVNELRLSPAPRAVVIFNRRFLGFRCAPPQALRCRPLRGLRSQVAALKRSSQPYSRYGRKTPKLSNRFRMALNKSSYHLLHDPLL